MNKIFLYLLPSLILISCGEEGLSSGESSKSENSLIAVEKPTGDNSATPPVINPVDLIEKEAMSGPMTSIEFIETEHHFGNVFYPSENMYTFKFKNTGKAPLTIVSATASCGCTVPNKPEEPILPGEIGELDVIFRPKQGQAGTLVTKKITVVANTQPKETYINIKADVLKGM
jgi:hypothetical protein